MRRKIGGEDGSRRSIGGGICCKQFLLFIARLTHSICHNFECIGIKIHDFTNLHAFLIVNLRLETYFFAFL